MCNRYVSPDEAAAERLWRVDARNQMRIFNKVLFPKGRGLFIRRARAEVGYSREMIAGRWGLIPAFAKHADYPYSTNNARSEELTQKASFKTAWQRGQRCIIPAQEFIEPNWETQKHVSWAFRRADGGLWGLAGIWNAWTDLSTGEVHESYSMLTLNANHHPLMSRMHKPELDKVTKQPLPLDLQDKRSVIPVELRDVDTWLAGTIEQAKELLRLAPVEVFEHGPEGPELLEPSLFD